MNKDGHSLTSSVLSLAGGITILMFCIAEAVYDYSQGYFDNGGFYNFAGGNMVKVLVSMGLIVYGILSFILLLKESKGNT